MTSDAKLIIGTLSQRAGVAPSALRFYEDEGLIHSTRTAGGQRRYGRDTLRRVAFIRVAQRVGLTLEEIREALASLPDGPATTEKAWGRIARSCGPALDAQFAILKCLQIGLEQ